jgi:hypothetical protein
MRILSVFFGILLFSLLISCGGSKKSTVPVVDENPRPSWVRSKPLESAFFHGVGFAYKVPGRDDHQQIARNNALNNLASEISVNISAQSLLYQVESDQRVRETFRSTIRSTSTARLQGYELIGSWENENEIWFYYRLSKSEHERIQREKRQKVLQMGMSAFSNAESEGDPYRKFLGYVTALDALKEYLGEPLSVEIEGQNIFLANHIMQQMRQMVDTWNLQASSNVVSVKRGQAVRIPSSFWEGKVIFFTLQQQRTPLVQVPVVLSYTERRNHQHQGLTDRNGHVYFVWDRIASQRSQEQLHARVDLRALASEASRDELVLAVVDKLREPSATITVEILPPLVFIQSRELLMNEIMDPPLLANAFANEFRKDGLEVTRNAAEADYVLDIQSQTRTGNGAGETTQFTTAYLDATIQLFEQPGRRVLFSQQLSGVRGVQLDDDRAARESYTRAIRDIQREVYPDLRRKAFN